MERIVHHRASYEGIWQACENMGNYFEKNLRDVFKGTNWGGLKFIDLANYSRDDFSIDRSVAGTQPGRTISQIATMKNLVESSPDADGRGRRTHAAVMFVQQPQQGQWPGLAYGKQRSFRPWSVAKRALLHRRAQYWLTPFLGRLVEEPGLNEQQVLALLEQIDNELLPVAVWRHCPVGPVEEFVELRIAIRPCSRSRRLSAPSSSTTP